MKWPSPTNPPSWGIAKSQDALLESHLDQKGGLGGMRNYLAVIGVAAALSSSSVLAQNAAADFWKKPGEVQRDAKGAIVYGEVKDASKFTMQVFDRGRTVTYHYAPNSLKILSAVTAGSTDEY